MSILIRRRWHAFLCGWFVVSLLPTLVVAQQNAPLILQAAIEHSLKGNLELKASGYDLNAQEGRIEQANARDIPLSISAGMGFVALLTLIVLPALYSLMQRRSQNASVQV